MYTGTIFLDEINAALKAVWSDPPVPPSTRALYKITGAQDIAMNSTGTYQWIPPFKAPKDTMRTFTNAKCGGRRR